MWQSHFPFTKINHQTRRLGEDKFIEHNYTFRGKAAKRYLVIAEQYEYNVFAVKYCLYEHKNCQNRFNRLTGFNECSRVVTTVGMIMKELFKENPYASFGFIGSELPGEERSNTKRFRLYASIVENIISPVHFEHRPAPKKSAYLMINRDNQEIDLLTKIESLFIKLYDF